MRWRRNTEVKLAVTDDDPLNARILKLATDLGNTVLAKKAANDLQALVPPPFNERGSRADTRCNSIKAKKASGFTKPAIFHKVMQILEAHHFRLPACRFVLDLFDKRVLRQIVLEEEDEEDSSESESEVEQAGTNGVPGAS
jgi:rapamycin-insensitive companion of mTOR